MSSKRSRSTTPGPAVPRKPRTSKKSPSGEAAKSGRRAAAAVAAPPPPPPPAADPPRAPAPPRPAEPASGSLPAGTVLDGRYRILEHLGAGGMAHVYRVEDLAKPGRIVALKLLGQQDASGDRGFQFQREFLCMTRLRHPNIVEVHDFGITAEGVPYFTMQLVPGHSLTELGAVAGFETLHLAFAEILETLSFIHSRGVLHRDLKPQNLLWYEDGESVRLQITDFGLAESVHPDGRTPLLGTVLYTPPEVACGMKADQRSDLYSLGVVLYEVLSGHPPFTGEDPVAVLRQHLDTEPAPLVPRVPDVPAGLVAIVHRMLHKRRAERYGSAEEVLQALDELSPRIRTRSAGAAAAVLTGDFVGREAEMERLSEGLGAARGGRGRALLVGGEAGSGKSRLLREFRSVCQLIGLPVALVHCQGQGSSPYQPLAELLGQLGLRPEDAGRHGLEPLFAAGAGELPQAERRSGLLEAFLRYLAELAERSGPVAPLVLLLEELHNAGEGTLEALRHLCRAMGSMRVLLVGTYLHEAVFSSYVWEERSPLAQLIGELDALECFSEIGLGRLGSDEVGAMIASMLGQPEPVEGLPAFCMEEAEGNPFVVEELMKALIAGGALLREGGAWRLERGRLEGLRLPKSVREIFERRLALCSPEARSVAELFSVLGRRVGYESLEQLWPDPAGRLPEWLDELLHFEILVSEDLGGRIQYGLAHNKLREVLYADLPAERRLALHQRVGLHMESRHAEHPEEVAAELEHHWSQVGDPERIRRYSRLSAAVARRSFVYDRAIESLERGRRIEEDPRAAHELALEIAELYTIVGQLGRAERLYEEALDTGEGGEGQADVLRRLGGIHHKRGEFRRAIERFEQALALSVEGVQSPGAARSMAHLAESHLALGQMERARDFCRRSLAVAAALGASVERARALEILGQIAAGEGAHAEGRRCFTEALELRQRTGDSLGVGNAYLQLGIVADQEREPERAIELLQKALEIFEKMRYVRGQAEVYRSLGRLYHRNRTAWELAQDYFTRSLAILERLGDEYAVARTCYGLGRLCEERGQFDRAAELYLRDMAIVNQVKDYAAMGRVLLRLGHLYLLRSEHVKAEFYLAQALSKLEKAATVGVRHQPLLWTLRALCSLEAGRIEEADERIALGIAALPQGRPGVERGGALLALAAVRRAQGRLQESDMAMVEGHDLLRAHGTVFDRAWAGLVRGRHLMLLGRDEEALRYLEHAREIFEKTGAKSFLQEVRSRITRIGEKQLASALGERTDPGDIHTLYQISQIFNSTLELKELLDRVMKVVTHQIHAERGYLILRDEASGEWRARSVAHHGSSPEELAALLSSGLIDAVAASGRPILSLDAESDPRFSGNVPLKLFGVKSILCTPLRAHDRVAGVLWLDHRAERGRFHERDLELMGLLATHASRALENAMLYEHYRSTMDSLSAGIVALSPRGAVVTCNRHAEELLGDELEAQFRNAGGSALAELAAGVLGGSDALEKTLVHEAVPGQPRRLHVRMKRLRDADGRAMGALCWIRDVTPIERLKEQVARESRLTAMGELATKIAGRMKNFLSGIRILAQGMERQLAGDGRAEYVQEILLEAEEAERYVTEHLSPKATLDGPRSTDMGRLIDEILGTLEAELVSRNITLRRELDPDPPALPVNPAQIREAIVNLCRNAMQAVGHDGVLFLASGRRELPGGRRVFSIAIQDNGPGIAPEHRARIFDPFFTTKEDGHGVGLWMVHNVVKSHGGSIDLETEPGLGTTFTIHLPV
jgi:signal transduction histidine kinase/tetratricopeptide (TPR) repeat protein